MADGVGCGSSACAIERRFIKKELLSWTKKIPIVVGLEVLAETIIGREVLHQLVASTSGGELSQTLPEDWNASRPCNLCSSIGPDLGKLQEHGSWQSDGNVEMLHSVPIFTPYSGFSDDGLNSPLDLRRYPINDQRSFEGDHAGRPVVELKVPRVVQKTGKHSASSNFGVKKNYTEQELVAATSEICSGKIGTRRASALYGIPRSTLRNKIFRLKSDVTAVDDNIAESPHLNSNKTIFPLDMFQSVDKIKLEYHAMEGWEQNLNQLYDAKAAPDHFERPYNMAMPSSSASMPTQNYFLEREKELSSHGCLGPSMEPKLPFLQRLIQEFAEKQIKSEVEEHWRYFGTNFGYKHPKPMDRFFMDDGSSSELKIPYYKPLRSMEKVKDSDCCSSPSPAIDWSSSEQLSTMSRSNRINNVLKDVITKTISEKFRSHRNFRNSDTFFSSLNGNNNSEAFSSDGSLCSEPMAKQPRTCLLTSLQMTASTSSSPDFEACLAESRSTSGSSDGEKRQTKGDKNMTKKTRPKRGQYRKYNRQLLLEAVKAVQKGDMSVHRAGSYYGVPHSTLEYKVKERHLLRQKKSLENSKSGESLVASTDGHGEEGSSSALGATTASSSDTASKLTTHYTPPMLYCKEPLEDNCSGPSLPSISPYSYRYPHDDGLLSVSSIPSATTPSLPLPVGCFRSALPVGFGWPPLITGMFPLSSVPRPLFDTQVPNFGFSMSASDLLKRLQQKVQANLSSSHEMQREVNDLATAEDRLAPLSPDMNSGRSSTCSIGSPQVAVS